MSKCLLLFNLGRHSLPSNVMNISLFFDVMIKIFIRFFLLKLDSKILSKRITSANCVAFNAISKFNNKSLISFFFILFVQSHIFSTVALMFSVYLLLNLSACFMYILYASVGTKVI